MLRGEGHPRTQGRVVTNGAPRPHSENAGVTARQATAIADMLDRGIPVDTIAAAHGCTRARVQAVADTAHLPRPAIPAPRARHRAADTSWDSLLRRARRIEDPRVQAQVDHILADLADLIAEVRLHEEREKAARALVEADRRAELLRRSYTDRHPGRRHTDAAVAP